MDHLDQALIEVSTFGCKVNTYDSGLLQKKFLGLEKEFKAGTKVHVLNSCAVTEEATSQVLRQARRLKREDPSCRVVVTGCSAQVDTERFEGLASVDLVVANSHKGELPELLKKMAQGEKLERLYKSNIFKKDDVEAGGGEELGHTRSFLKIQDGCDSFCTFCVIPFARGKSRSIAPDELVKKINEIHARGVQEVVLTGVHIGDYQSSHGEGLTSLVGEVLAKTNIPRVRLSSLEPIELNLELLQLWKNPRLCPHFHMSIQSASTSVLQKMKRKYAAEGVKMALDLIASHVPGAFVGMDVIAGFPEESEVDFEDSLQLLSSTSWTRMHVFPYSSRPNTYASRALKPLGPAQVKERAFRLRELSRERHAKQAISQLGQVKEVLWLKSKSAQVLHGLSRDYWPVVVEKTNEFALNCESRVKITGSEREEGRTGELKLYGILD